uniref:Putative chromatin modifying protein 4B n=1 Tax=Maconellicoccus hirsutus TaxID=177089 RepID=A2I435_MACHI|nr:putative chromatin modifying protein 4B [Maconellicoccus hirsutus]
MSFLSKVFGGKKEEKGPTTAEAIQNLRQTEEMLMKKQSFLEKKIDEELAVAKANGTKNKRAAIQALKRKNRYAKQLQQIDGTLATIEMQREALEGANTNTAVLTTMKSAADALKKAHQNMDVDQVHEMMDDIAEQQDVAKEISEAISNPVALGHDYDDDELEKELEQLEQEALDAELLKAGPSGMDVPVPTEEPVAIPGKARAKPSHTQQEEDDMKELQMWAS